MTTATAVFSKNDEKIRDAVIHQLDWEPDFNASGVGVTVDDGVATLTGVADSYAAKLAIERAVKRVYGVRGVANDIEVKLTDERNDTDVAHACLQALRSRISVPPQVKVSVRNGHVFLEGAVD
jgi:osmotically-inducible protein OsmY